MKVLFVYSVELGPSLRSPLHNFGQMQFGISYISAVLKRAGVGTKLVVLTSESEPASLSLAAEVMRDYDPDIIAFTCVATQFPFMDKVARLAKRSWPGKYLIVGGPHVSLNPEEPLRSVFDAVCLGEGEHAMLELVEQLQAGRQPDGISNLWLKCADGSVQRNGTRPFIADLDALPFADHELWLPWIHGTEPACPPILLGRGCPYLCTYCSNHALRSLAPGKYVRFRTPGSIMEEIRYVLAKFPCDAPSLSLWVETIGVHKQWTLDLCAALQQLNRSLPQPATFDTNLRVTAQTLDPMLFRALASANFRNVNIGLEAGSERVRKDILKRNYSNGQFLRAVQLAHENGLQVNVFNMIGIPGETMADHLETVRLNRESRPTLSFTSIFFPYPGTELYRVCEQRGLLTAPIDARKERKKAALDLPEFPRRAVQRAYDLFDWRIHKGHWPLHVRIRKLARHYAGKFKLTERIVPRVLPVWRGLAKLGLINRSFGRND
jgi:anaerobic magnesium-protoporphyrin IX monomethyl ester cyclase